MEDVLETQDASGDNTNFMAASCALDASVKIYSCRVDSVHTDTYKVLGGLTRTERESIILEESNEEEAINSMMVDELQDDSSPRPKLKKARTSLVNTLESNIEALNGKKLDKGMLVDPLFQKTSAAFDKLGAKGLLLNHLSVHEGCTLAFDSTDTVDSFVASTTNPIVDISDLRDLLAEGGDIQAIERLQVCSTFSDFEFDTTETPDISLVMEEDEGENGGMDGEMFFGGGDFSPDNPIVDLNEENSADDRSEMNRSQNHPDFQFFDSSLAKTILGPHWQFATPTPKKKRETTSRKRKLEKKPKKEFLVDFMGDLPPASVFAIPNNEQLISLPNSAYSKKAGGLVTLPDDPAYTAEDLQKLFTKAKFLEYVFNSTDQDEDLLHFKDDNDESEGFGNDADSIGDFHEDMSMEIGTLDSDNEPKTAENENSSAAQQTNENTTNEKLVEKPDTVKPLSINYTKTATKANIQALKTLIWKELCNRRINNNELDFEGEQDFGTLLRQVEELAQKEKEKDREEGKENDLGDVSVAMCFISTLQLCNEKGLLLMQNHVNELFIVNHN